MNGMYQKAKVSSTFDFKVKNAKMRYEIEALRNINMKASQFQNGLNYYKSSHYMPQIIVDAELKLVKANCKAREIFRLAAHDIGQPIQALRYKFKFKDLFDHLEKVFENPDTLNKLANKKISHCKFQVLPYSMDGEQPYQAMLINMFNNSERRRRLRHLEKLNRKYQSIIFSGSNGHNGPLINIQQLIYEIENVVENDEESRILIDLLNLSVLKMKNYLFDLRAGNIGEGIPKS